MIYFIKKYLKYILLSICVVISFVTIYVSNMDKNINTSSVKKLSVEKKSDKSNLKTIYVDVKGAVNKPGVYELEEGKRVIDAINLAEGFNGYADPSNINLSKKLTDEMFIIVYSKVEIANYKKNNGNSKITCASTECLCPDSDNDACITSSNESITKSSNASSTIVSINTASKEELMTLSGIGESKANAIIKFRQEQGGFKTIEDIKNVSGIGDTMYEKIKNNITI